MNLKAKGAMHLAVRALKQATDAKDRVESLKALDVALKCLADVVFLEDIHPMDHGISIDIVPVIIQLKLASRSIQLSSGKDLR